MAQITSQRHFRPMSRRAKLLKEKIGARGFEPPTSWSRTKRATRLRYAPAICSLPACQTLSADLPDSESGRATRLRYAPARKAVTSEK